MLGFETTFSANLGTDLQTEEKFGKTINSFRMAVRQSAKADKEPVWLTAEIPDFLLEYAAKLTKGTRVWVTGSMKVDHGKDGKIYFNVYVRNLDAMVRESDAPF